MATVVSAPVEPVKIRTELVAGTPVRFGVRSVGTPFAVTRDLAPLTSASFARIEPQHKRYCVVEGRVVSVLLESGLDQLFAPNSLLHQRLATLMRSQTSRGRQRASVDVTTHRYQHFPLRSVQLDGAPWFLTADVTRVLGFSRTALHRSPHTRLWHHSGFTGARSLVHADGVRELVGKRMPLSNQFAIWFEADVMSCSDDTAVHAA